MILITGASGGLGLEFAKIFSKNGHDLLLVARSGDKLKKICKDLKSEHPNLEIKWTKKDLSKTEEIDELFAEVKQNNYKLSGLINNAGFGKYGDFDNIEMKNQLEMIDLNVRAITQLSWLFIEHCNGFENDKNETEFSRPKILNVASIAGFQPVPRMSVYGSSKSFVLNFSLALCEEFKNRIDVCCLCPGPTKTSFFKVAGMGNKKLSAIEKISMSAEEVAKITYKNMYKNKIIIVPGIVNKIGAFLSRRVPLKLIAKISGKVF